MCLSHFCRVRVTSPSSQSRVRVIQKFFESSQSHDLVESSQSRVTKTVESLRVIGLQARVNVESHEISHFFYDISYAMKWRPICCKMVPDKLENGAQHAIEWCPIGKKQVPSVVSTSLIARYLYLSFISLHFTCPFHSQSFQKVQPNFAASVATTRLVLCGMCDSPRTGCAQRATHKYM